MKKLVVLMSCLAITACVTERPKSTEKAEPLESSVYMSPDTPPEPPSLDLRELENRLGLSRGNQDLGFEERAFNGCLLNLKDTAGKCGQRYLSVVHFRLVCRDTVETAQDVAATLTPLSRGQIEWRLAGVTGRTQTDGDGYGQVQSLGDKAAKGQRFILIMGGKSLGVTVNEVSQIVLPGNWCSELAAR